VPIGNLAQAPDPPELEPVTRSRVVVDRGGEGCSCEHTAMLSPRAPSSACPPQLVVGWHYWSSYTASAGPQLVLPTSSIPSSIRICLPILDLSPERWYPDRRVVGARTVARIAPEPIFWVTVRTFLAVLLQAQKLDNL
jgi:hypothetical protein